MFYGTLIKGGANKGMKYWSLEISTQIQ